MSSTKRAGKPPCSANGTGSTVKTPGVKVPMRGLGNEGNSSSSGTALSQSRVKTQSQEDLTKSKDRPSCRPKTSGASSSSYGSSRRPTTTKEGQRASAERLSRDKNRPSSASSNTGSKSSAASGRTSAVTQKRKESAGSNHRGKSDDKATLEAKIKDLVTAAKDKDSEIKSLKEKLDSMSQFMDQLQVNNESNDDVTSSESDSPGRSSKSSDDNSPATSDAHAAQSAPEEFQSLRDENLKLKEQLDAMMLSMRQKTDTEKSLMLLQRQSVKHIHGADTDASSHDGDALGSSVEDLASASMYPASRGTSHSDSAENLLNVDSSCDTHSRGDDKMLASSDGSDNSAAAVVCLTEKIHRMEESQISTNEELEATVQELADLQKSVPELTIDNTRLKQEKQYLMQKLCDTEKRLDQKESEVQHLRVLLNDRVREDPDKSSVEQQYMQLLDEREHLLDLQDETNNRLRSAEQKAKEATSIAAALEEQNRKLERELASITAERNRLDKTVQDLREASTDRNNSIAVQHLEESLHQEREKVDELIKKQALLAAGDADGSEEVLAVLQQLRNEKHDMEEKYILAEEDVGQLKEENERLDDRVAELEEEMEAAAAKTRKDLSELSEVIDRLQEQIRHRDSELENAKETIFLLEDAVEQNMAVKKHDNHMISKLQAQMSTLKEEKFRLGKEIHQLKKEQKTQSEEWKQFQADLQMAVMIANDMKAETQSEVARLREENQILDERLTKLQVENEQLRRRRKTTSSINFPADPDQRQKSVEKELAALRESWGVSRRYGEQHSPGVQTLIKSFDNHIMQVAEQAQKNSPPGSPGSPTTPEPQTKKPAMSDQSSPFPSAPKFSPSKTLSGLTNGQKPTSGNGGNSPITAEVAPMQRHHSMSAIQPHPAVDQSLSKITSNVQHQSKPGTPENMRANSAADLTQLSSLLLSRDKRNSSNPDSRKQSFESRKPLADLRLDRLSPSNAPSSPTPSITGSTTEGRDSPSHPAVSTPPVQIRHRVMSTPGGSSLATLARRYGGSKRNALLKWCQEKTKGYAGIDITNFSSSWNDGLAFCALVHSHLPAHIPYDTLQQQLVNSTDGKSNNMLQAKNFRLAFAAAESVGIEPSLSVEEMTNNERPDWQRVMRYVTEIYKYFEM